MLKPILLAASLGAACLATSPTLAADGATVTVPIGDWIAAGVTDLASVLLAVASYIVARWVPQAVRTYLTEQLLQRAVDYAVAVVAGAARGRVLTVPVANQVLAEAMAYAIDHAPGTAKWLGDTLKPKLLARLGAAGVLPPDARGSDFGLPRVLAVD